jgi:ornithine decarboxylase
MRILDIGGGWPGLSPDGTCRTNSGIHFEQIAMVVRSLLAELFPNEDGQYKIMAEPGRFFAAGCAAQVSYIHSKAVDIGPFGEKLIRYYINDGLYGSFNSVLYDHASVSANPLDDSPGAMVACSIFGPTCDGSDKVADNVVNLPEMEIGDRLIWLSMGAYTTAASTTFNGFTQPQYYYYRTMNE